MAWWTALDWPCWALLLLQGVTATLFGWDKWRAKTGRRRVPERTLLLWSLAGGWLGGLIAMLVVRHKIRKRSFMRRFWLGVVVSTVAWAAILLTVWRP